ncbi:MAG: nitrogen fixation protein NifZ [Gloeomargarita sp. SKYBB_i_bin120]|nr:nitrogen fixation protein NifZ [Gloeomargarita sp. SKYG98]MCS7292685.1 nitrogen fixation protein NifZ [Gloeomargarita sp. SKYB120]MDW8178247.1 nitrogen fixation protein NifZ [Gloeomargarita sp. SKYBB_i_bin120]
MDRRSSELDAPPQFELGQKVRLTRTVRNDGTFIGRGAREVLARKGAVGYVVGIGTFLQAFYIYSVHFVELGIVVGCRGHELESLEPPDDGSVGS